MKNQKMIYDCKECWINQDCRTCPKKILEKIKKEQAEKEQRETISLTFLTIHQTIIKR